MMNSQDDRNRGTDAVLTVRGLEKTYRGSAEAALKGIDITVGPGEIVGLLGPNGAGKTTAISIMTGLLQPNAGKVVLCGTDLFRQPRRARRYFGLVPQDIALYPQLTAAENLSYFGRLHGLNGRLLRERVDACLALAGLENRRNDRVITYSGGMKRRANLAAGLLHQPRLLFLDEPTVGIDIQSRNLILEQLARIGREGIGMIYTTHYMEEVEQICSRVAIIDEGRSVAQGTLPDLLAGKPDAANLGELFLSLTGKQLRD